MSSSRRTKTLANVRIGYAATPSPSAETVANNDDLLNEILLRLPFKSLLRFKSVSKHWLSLISDPNFSFRRNCITDSTSGLFFLRRGSITNDMSEFDLVNLENLSSSSSRTAFGSLSFADSDLYSANELIQTCNGLLLCYFCRAEHPRDYFIYNPTTKLYTKLPPIFPGEGKGPAILGLSLAFDPSISPHYKVICVRASDTVMYGSANKYQIEIYSSETRYWRLSGGSFDFDNTWIGFLGGVYCNGYVHWISSWGSSAYFNVEEELIRPLPMPPIPEDSGYLMYMYRYFGESRGHLHLLDHIYDLQSPRFDVLEIDVDYSGWFIKFRVDLSDFPRVFPQIVRTYQGNFAYWSKFHKFVFTVLCVVRSEVDEESYLVLQIPGKVIRYNFKTGTFFKLCDYVCEPDNVFPEIALPPHAHQHSESLALV